MTGGGNPAYRLKKPCFGVKMDRIQRFEQNELQQFVKNAENRRAHGKSFTKCLRMIENGDIIPNSNIYGRKERIFICHY